jgi:hypothetical protein
MEDIKMIRELLHELYHKNYDAKINKKLQNLIIDCNDQQLSHMLFTGIKLTNNIDLFCYAGSGFRCINEDENMIGRLHICNLVENFLNKKLQEKLYS